MAITQAMCTSFKKELLEAVHNFKNSGGNDFKLALYTSSASLGASTTAYTTSNEASGTNYTAKGASLTRVDPSSSGTTALTDFADLTFSSATITANGAMIFNDTASGDPAVCVLAFGGDKTSTNGDFTIQFPAADASNAIIRIAQQPMANLTGWGRGTWGQLTFGEPIPAVVTGVASTSALGSETVVATATLAVTGNVGTSTLGSETVAAEANISASGNAGTSALGNAITAGAAVTGVSGSASAGELGDESVTAGATVLVTGNAATSGLGSVTTTSANVLTVTGVSSTGTLGSITVLANNVIVVEGVFGTGTAARVNVWGLVPDSQTPSYSEVSVSQTPSYTNVTDNQTPDWKEVA